ncbi:DNA primase [Solilutibacter silvestris]|uniref:DNA primase n=1 Tax=Solilutibacter silvestris TaxID=1645665 RepID=A0A2K1Q1L5_9GAMM|nr:DNA primase [Lysobacter silvestris]PNS08922.1 dnaG: DNA primase [Lysobacter silvestris]
MARIPDAFIDDLLNRTDVVEIVNARVPLKKKGNEYTACCPFHDERSPSFFVSPTKQFYHCFGCGAHGSAINFLMQFDRLEFLDAIDELAKRAGMEIPRDTAQRNANPETQPLFGALDAAAAFFKRQLASSSRAQAYLDQRGVDAATRERFAIGYAPQGYDGLRNELGTDPRRMQLLERAGLFSRNDKDHVYDKFRDRVMFPIHDRRGRVIAFGGRVLDKDSSPKYLNSPETALFHKGRELYGLWQARQANPKLERLLVVEGYMDVVSLAQHGIVYAVATLGTATTPEHAELLFRNAPDVVFCFDGDAAGRRAAWKALESVLPRMKDGRQAFFLFLPDGEDPDTLIRQEGHAGFVQRLHAATPLSEVYFAERLQGISLTSITGKATLVDRCRADIARIPDGGFRDAMIARIRELTGVDVTDAAAIPRTAMTSNSNMHAKRSLVRHAITLLLQHPPLAERAPFPYAFEALELAGIPLLVELLDVLKTRPGMTAVGILEAFGDHPDVASLQKLATQNEPGGAQEWVVDFDGVLAQLAKQSTQQRVDQLQARIRELDEHEKTELRELLQLRFAAPTRQ